MAMQRITYDNRGLRQWIKAAELEEYEQSLGAAEKMLADRSGPGGDFVGWLNLPKTMKRQEIGAIAAKADEVRGESDVLLCIGIGGSYLGARAAIDFLSHSFDDMRKPRVLFAGHSVNSDYLSDLLSLIADKEVSVNIISKSGATIEPGIAFRVIRAWMEKKYSKAETCKRIIVTTDPRQGALRALADAEGYATFAIPPDVGGRFSALTPVALFPMAVAGVDIGGLVQGAREAMDFCSGTSVGENLSGRYAVIRNILFRRGKQIEVMAAFQPQLHFFSKWWQQLAGESEGKNLTGIFPASLDYTQDLHSLGQWMQEGARTVFETFVVVKNTNTTLTVPPLDNDGDGLGYLTGRSFEEINMNAYKGTLLAHLDGGVPCTTLTLEDRSAETLGQAFYFFEKAIALSGYILRVNPFDQPGVEAYKQNMFALLSKPGFEKQGNILTGRLKDLSG